jgi:hypothetical protein
MKGLGINANINCSIVCGLGFLSTLQQVCALSTTDFDFVPVCENHFFGVNFNEMYEIKISKTKAFFVALFPLVIFVGPFLSGLLRIKRAASLRN